MPETEKGNQYDTQEPENLDQTDFIENSTFAFQEGDVFPNKKDIEDLLLGKNKNDSGQTETTKAKLFPTWMLVLAGGLGFILLLIIILVVVLAFRNGGNNLTPAKQNQLTENQKALNLLEERILAIENLERTLVLPQSRELIIP